MKSDQKRFLDVCELGARVETNVPQGGDAGHGGKTRITLTDEGSFALGDAHGGYTGPGASVEIEVLGDAEARVLADALGWTAERLRAMVGD
jgi:hypothetical protein